MVAGQEWKGAWAGTTAYKVDDVVQWGGSTFVCNEAHTSQSDLYDDTSKWTSFVPGFKWTGNYTASTAYKVNDLRMFTFVRLNILPLQLLILLNLLYSFLD